MLIKIVHPQKAAKTIKMLSEMIIDPDCSMISRYKEYKA